MTDMPIAGGWPAMIHTKLGGRFSTLTSAPRTSFQVAIAAGASLSGAVDLGELTAGAIILPADWTAASLTFLVSADGVTYVPLYGDGIEIAYPVSTSICIRLYPSEWASFRYLKVRSGTASAPVAQVLARTLTIIARPV